MYISPILVASLNVLREWKKKVSYVFKYFHKLGICILVLTSGLLLGWSCPNRAETFNDPAFTSEVVATLPPYTLVGLDWAPDGRLFVWQKNGVVRVIKNGVLLPTPFLDLSSQVNTFDDRGMWGLAFDPDFSNNRYLYLSYVYEEGGNSNDSGPKTARLSHVTADSVNPDIALPNSERVILGTISAPPCSAYLPGADCIPADGSSHTIGKLLFAPDGKLWIGNGDGADDSHLDLALRSQNLDSINGKILRVNPDGTAPGNNPFDDGSNSIRSKVWLYGVRNPFGFALNPTSGDPYIGDVGWNTWEEMNRGQRGGNFGWPCYEGTGTQSYYQTNFSQCNQLLSINVISPIYTYNHSTGSTAIIGGPFYTANIYPQTYQGNLFFADYTGNWIRRMVLDANGNPNSNTLFATNVQAPVAIEQGPDGLLYYLSFTTGEIRRIRYNGPNAVASATPNYGYSPLSVNFSSSGSTSGVGITYLWDFGDGTTSTSANPSHTYTVSGVRAFTVRLTVTNLSNQSSSATLSITVGSTPPTSTIQTPSNGTGFLPGQVVSYQGSAIDPDDGVLSSSALKWTVLLHHNSHIHTFVSGSGASGSFVAENHGAIGTFSYEIILTATDSSGLSSSTSVNVPVLAPPPDTEAPTVPVLQAPVVAGSTQINLSWSASTDNVGVTNYLVERCKGAGCSNFTQVGQPSGTSFNDASLTPSTSYSYRVRATDGTNFSGYSNTMSATTADIPPLPSGIVAAYSFNEGTGPTVTDISGNGNNGTINGATWTAQGKYGSALSFNGTSNLVAIPASASLNVSAAMTLEAWVNPMAAQSGWRTIMQRETDAYFLNASNGGGALQPAGGATFGGTVDYTAAPSAIGVNTWNHVALTYDGTIMRLYVNGAQVASKTRTGTIETNSNPLRIGGNVPYGEYFQGLIDEVRVYNRALSATEVQADMSTPMGGVPAGIQAPTALTATAASASQINLSWMASTTAGVTSYLVERCQGAGCSNFAQQGTSAGTNYNDTDLTANTSYSYRVRATNGTTQSGYSNAASATTLATSDAEPPTTPSNVTATVVGSSQINLSWNASTDNVGVTSYLVERCQSAGCSDFIQVAAPSTTSYNNTGLTANTSYSYRVRATDGTNFSGYSAPVSATTAAIPPLPAGIVAAYAFDEGTGSTVSDLSGNGNTGTLNGATWTTQGKYGNALSFNGVNNLVAIPGSSSLNVSAAMTLEAWVNPSAAQSGWRTIMQREVDAYFLNASTDAGALFPGGGGAFGGTTDFTAAPSALALNTWSHVTLTYDGANMRLYVNGIQVSSKARTGAVETNTNPLRIGGNVPYGEYFQGLIDEVRVYNRALSAAEVQTDMNTPMGSVPAGIQAPTALTATAAGAIQINLSWVASTTSGVTGYLVERCQGVGCSNFGQIGTSNGVSYNDTGLTANTSYSYRVRATNGTTQSGYSNTASATTQSVTNQPPNFTSTAAGTATVGVLYSYTAVASDPEGNNPVTFTLVAGSFPSGMTLTGSTINWTPIVDQTGAQSFTVRATDSLGASRDQINNVVVASSTNTAPTANNDTFLYRANITRTVNYTGPLGLGVLANDTDAENNPLSAILIAGSLRNGGTLNLATNGSFTYIRPTGNNNVSFAYRASDSSLLSSPATGATVLMRIDAAPTTTGDNCTYDRSANTVTQPTRCSVTALRTVRMDVVANDTDSNVTTNIPTDGIGDAVVASSMQLTVAGTGVDVAANPLCGQNALGIAPGSRATIVNNCNGTLTVTMTSSNTQNIQYSYTVQDNLGATSSARSVTLTSQQ